MALWEFPCLFYLLKSFVIPWLWYLSFGKVSSFYPCFGPHISFADHRWKGSPLLVIYVINWFHLHNPDFSPHFKILNIKHTCKDFLPCKETHSQVLWIRAWISLGRSLFFLIHITYSVVGVFCIYFSILFKNF